MKRSTGFIAIIFAIISASALLLPPSVTRIIEPGASGQSWNAPSMSDRPLPYAAHWNMGEMKDGFSPSYQMSLIDKGDPLLPWFLMPNEFADPTDPRWLTYYEAAIKKAAQYHLPISFVGTQWEILLSTTDEYLNLPPDRNPNVVTTDGQVRPEVSPFGPIGAWREAGMKWGSSKMLKKLQEWYPDPPKVLFVSNHENPKLQWTKAEDDIRFFNLFARGEGGDFKRRFKVFGRGVDGDFKRKAVGDGWIERYQALHQGLREGLSAQKWRENATFIAYDAFGPSHFARWPGWMEYSLYSSGRIDPWQFCWDGASTSFYVFNWNSSTDFTVFSPQVEAMNWVFMLNEAQNRNPNFWFEISTWDGHEKDASDKRQAYEKAGQKFTSDRYAGMVQFGMWLLRPRGVREFRGYMDTLSEAEPYFLPIVDAVKRVHGNPILREFWQKGELVPNRWSQHPYQSNVPSEYQYVDRWFMLDTSLDPPRPWELNTQLPVFAIALVKGKAPQRQWLIYAHSPQEDRAAVMVSVPGYRTVTMNVSVKGTFYLIDEKSYRSYPVY